MRKIHVHALAESDLIDIWQYSFEEWGEIQADNYLGKLDNGIRKLANNPELGMKRDNVRDGYRVLFVVVAGIGINFIIVDGDPKSTCGP